MVFNYDLMPVTDLVDLCEALKLHTMATLTASRRNITNIQTVADRSPFSNAGNRVGSQGRGVDQICTAELAQAHKCSPGMGDRGVDCFFAGVGIQVAEGHAGMPADRRQQGQESVDGGQFRPRGRWIRLRR